MQTCTRFRIAVPIIVPLVCAGQSWAQSEIPGGSLPDSAGALAATHDLDVGSWSFGVGETFEYAVAVGPARVGRASLGVERWEVVDGVGAYRVAMEVKAGLPFFGFDDRWESWIATGPLRALRIEQRVEEGDSHRHDRFEVDYEAGRILAQSWDDRSGGFVPSTSLEAPTSIGEPVLDDVGFLYLLRMLPLEVGRTYRFESHFLTRGNPVVFHVIRREEIRVPAGRFRTIVIEPVLPGMGILAPGRNARAYISDDPQRRLVLLTTSTRFGTVALHLRRYEPGAPVEPRDAIP